jgi:hypothetical protein
MNQQFHMHETHLSETLLATLVNFWNPRSQHGVTLLLGRSFYEHTYR